jgi:hypothetical protein
VNRVLIVRALPYIGFNLSPSALAEQQFMQQLSAAHRHRSPLFEAADVFFGSEAGVLVGAVAATVQAASSSIRRRLICP